MNGFSKNIGWKISPGDRTGNCFLTLFKGAICENLGNCGKNVQTWTKTVNSMWINGSFDIVMALYCVYNSNYLSGYPRPIPVQTSSHSPGPRTPNHCLHGKLSYLAIYSECWLGYLIRLAWIIVDCLGGGMRSTDCYPSCVVFNPTSTLRIAQWKDMIAYTQILSLCTSLKLDNGLIMATLPFLMIFQTLYHVPSECCQVSTYMKLLFVPEGGDSH